MLNDDYLINWIEQNKGTINAGIEQILGVKYVHLKLPNNDDLYITQYGFACRENLKPENFLTDKKWYEKNSCRLSGTSCTYKVHTKKVTGISLDIVIKWNRMGQDIPGAHELHDFYGAEFNSPFEEFSLVFELRRTKYESPGKILTQKPLAIYVPDERIELWQTGRSEYKMQYTIRRHEEVAIDMFRPYIMIYEWVKGIDALEAYKAQLITREEMETLTVRTDEEMLHKGYVVKDRKPQHIIVRPVKNNDVARDLEGNILYALVDFELLERTPEREELIKKAKRKNYLRRQMDRFKPQTENSLPGNLKHITILDVEYVYGHTESTYGVLWVVGRDPDLFDYFLPERWEKTHRTRLSTNSEIYHTVTKDGINLVWKVSRVGSLPDLDPFKEDEKKIIEYGYNSPFEEISIAIFLGNKGIRTVFPRAIYMTGEKTNIAHTIFDESRFLSHKSILTPEGTSVLRQDRNYMLIWGYWNGPDEKLAVLDGNYYKGINALNAYRNHLISCEQYIEIIKRKKERLAAAGVEDLNLRGSHLLLSLDTNNALVLDKNGNPDVRICNFEFLKTMPASSPQA